MGINRSPSSTLTNEPLANETHTMSRAVVNDIAATGNKVELEYETIGSPDGVPLLLIMGFGAQLTLWPDGFCQLLADGGCFVIRFDNRDCGLSTKLDGVKVDIDEVLAAALSDRTEGLSDVPYTLSDMAADAVGLLDHLGLAAAHIVGASMGGMIAQMFAIEHPGHTLSLVSIMSNPGDPDLDQPGPEAGAVLLAAPPADRETFIEQSVSSMIWQSKKYANADEVRAQAARDYDRSFYPEGTDRQLAAIYASGRRSAMLSSLNTPTLVVHGRDDTLLLPIGGSRTAELIPGANLLMMADMGHDLPEPLWPVIVDAIIANTNR
jgi:pimeloyl-ACP methyl ester carboxylesterase